MLIFNDPSSTTPVDIDGATFHCKTLTTGQRLVMMDELQGLKGIDTDFDKLMEMLAGYIQSISYGKKTITKLDDIKKHLVYMDNIVQQNELISGVMKVNRLSKGQVAN